MTTPVDQYVEAFVKKNTASGAVIPPVAGDVPIALGTGKAVWGSPGSGAVTSIFSTYTATTFTETTDEVVLSSPSGFIGSLVFPAGQRAGTVIRFRMALTIGDNPETTSTVMIRIKTQDTTILTHAFSLPGFAKDDGVTIDSYITVAATTARFSSCGRMTFGNNDTPVVIGTAPYDPTIVNTFTVTGQWDSPSAICTMARIAVTSMTPLEV